MWEKEKDMRLIDADEFKDIILTYGKAGYRALPIEKISELIDGQSTAYDVDKVVEQVRSIPHGETLNVELEEEIAGIVESGGID